MAIFARRRLQSMLFDVSPFVDREKAQDLIRRIESKRIDQALPGEIELAVIWSMAQIGPIEVEPFWFGSSSQPDAFSDSLIPGYSTVVEVAALSDAALPGDEGMRNASRKISHEANKIRRGAGHHMSYFFFEDSTWEAQESKRWIKVPRDLKISEYIECSLKEWLKDVKPTEGDRIRLQEGQLDVLITWHAMRQSQYNFRSSMPPEIRSLRDNYLYRVLRAKAKQLDSPLFEGLRCVILADVGSTALRQLESRDPVNRICSGSEIISEYLRTPSCGIDLVVVMAPRRVQRNFNSTQQTVEWELTAFPRSDVDIKLCGFDRLLDQLPPPELEGYQSRQLHEQGFFHPSKRGRHLSTKVTWRRGEETEIRISARALVDVLAGRETPERFLRNLSATGNDNLFKIHLDRGETISSITLEEKGPDDDDDWIVVKFKDDAAARLLSNPHES